MRKVKKFANIFLLMSLIIMLSGCSGLEVTQTSKTIEAGSKTINPIKMINVKNYNQYNISVISSEIDTSKLGKYEVEYSIKSKDSNKEYKKKFKFDVVDTTAPEIILGKDISVSMGDAFNPLDYVKIKDNYDQDISKESLVVDNTVDVSKKGTYFVNYSVSDSAGNKATASSQVKVTDKPLKIGEKITSGTVDFAITSAEFSNNIRPSAASGYYSYYQAKDPDNKTYLDIVGSFKNLSGNSVKLDDIVKIKLIYDGKYEYDGFSVIEKDGDFEIFEYIDPLTTEKFRDIIEVPLEVKSSGKTLILVVEIKNLDSVRYTIR